MEGGVVWLTRSLVMDVFMLSAVVLAGSIFEDTLRFVFRKKKEPEVLPIEKWMDDRYLGIAEEMSAPNPA